MSLSELVEVMPQPSAPLETGDSARWLFVEKMVGLTLPSDYKDFIDTYGTCWIGGFLYIWNPFSKTDYFNLLIRLRDYGDADPRELPYPFYPAQPGLLPFGSTKNGDTLFWITEGESETWMVLVLDARAPEYDRYPFGMTVFLTNLIKGTVKGRLFGSDEIDQNKLFDNMAL